jgi:hypothetical protein
VSKDYALPDYALMCFTMLTSLSAFSLCQASLTSLVQYYNIFEVNTTQKIDELQQSLETFFVCQNKLKKLSFKELEMYQNDLRLNYISNYRSIINDKYF